MTNPSKHTPIVENSNIQRPVPDQVCTIKIGTNIKTIGVNDLMDDHPEAFVDGAVTQDSLEPFGLEIAEVQTIRGDVKAILEKERIKYLVYRTGDGTTVNIKSEAHFMDGMELNKQRMHPNAYFVFPAGATEEEASHIEYAYGNRVYSIREKLEKATEETAASTNVPY